MTYLDQVDHVYGPYTRSKDGRKTVFVTLKDGRLRSVSYPKFLVEVVLGRELDPKDETVDHIDGDHNNNDWRNMRVVSLSKHAGDDAIRVRRIQVACVWCEKSFSIRPSQIKHKASTGQAGPFCGDKCKGHYGAELQNGRLGDANAYRQWHKYTDTQPVYYTVTKVGETVCDMVKRLELTTYSEDEILHMLPRKQVELNNTCLHCGQKTYHPKYCSQECRTLGTTVACTVCGNTTTNKKFCSIECSRYGSRKAERPSKEELTELVWKHPASSLAKTFGVSDVAIGKWCRAYGIDRPPRGYWAKARSFNNSPV